MTLASTRVAAMVSLRRLVGARGTCAAYAGSVLLVSVGALDFTLFSGMEFALFVALVLHAFVLAGRVLRADAYTRARAQWRLGAWGVLLEWTRPEAAVLVAVLSVLAARHARSQSPIRGPRLPSPCRVALATGAVALLQPGAHG